MMELQAALSPRKALKGVRLLVVEDDAILLMELEEILQDAGAEIVGCCRTVKDALASVEADAISAAVLDVRIGSETIAPVARRLGRRGTPFLFYTGQVIDDPALEEWRDCKIVAKPAQAQTIVSAVIDILHRSQ
jgi:DNA-binding NtrC family response regulator